MKPPLHSSIRFIYFVKRSLENPGLVLIPEEFRNSECIEFIKQSPKNILQLCGAFDFFEKAVALDIPTGVDFSVVYFDSIKIIEEYKLFNQDQVTLLFIDAEDCELGVIQKLIDSIIGYKYIFICKNKNNKTSSYTSIKEVKNPLHFIESIKSVWASIKRKYEIKENFNLVLDKEYIEMNKYSTFRPAQTNFFILNQLLQNYWVNLEYYLEQESNFLENDSQSAKENASSYDRQELLIHQANLIDRFNAIMYWEKLAIPVSGVEPLLNPLVLVYPYHSRHLKEEEKSLAKERTERGKAGSKLFKFIQAEQGTNYTIHVNPKDISDDNDLKILQFSHQVTAERLRFLDDMAYLHSSFFPGPVIRLPLIGASINKEISYLAPRVARKIITVNSLKKLNKTIKNIGDKLVDNRLSKEMTNYLKQRNGQIVVISDLPLEWMTIDGVPLGFTHDVCRIPESTSHSVLSHYTKSIHREVVISNNIYSKVLVVFGCEEPNFLKWRDTVTDLSNRLKFNTEICLDIESLSEAIEKYQPDILIIDSHGGTDHSDSTHLYLGDNMVTNDDIKKHQITAPIVFLSACMTSPNYGYHNSIAQSFFELGAISVTATFLPVGIDTGSLLYYRLLNKLGDAVKFKIHKNWLDFISHVVRTSSVFESFNNKSLIKERTEEHIDNEIRNLTLNSITELLSFNSRRNVYKEMDNRITKLTNKKRDFFKTQIPEYLFYSHLGRPDLIYFESYIQELRKINIEHKKRSHHGSYDNPPTYY